MQTAYDRSAAAERQLGALKDKYYKAGKKEGFFEVLDAQRQLADALERYYQSRVEYAMAIRSVHYEKGSLLEYCDICLSEGGWPTKAYRDAARREGHRGADKSIDYILRTPPVVAQNPPGQISAAAAAGSRRSRSAHRAPTAGQRADRDAAAEFAGRSWDAKGDATAVAHRRRGDAGGYPADFRAVGSKRANRDQRPPVCLSRPAVWRALRARRAGGCHDPRRAGRKRTYKPRPTSPGLLIPPRSLAGNAG